MASGAGLSGAGIALLSLLDGTHTARVWYGGPTKQRVALLGTVGETDIFRDGTNLWSWASTTKVARHTTLSTDADLSEMLTPTLTPDQLVTQTLAVLDSSTAISTADPRVVAGRSAYELVLTPPAGESTIASMHIFIDGKQKVPLGVQIYARSQARHNSPAIDVSYTSITFGLQDDSNFAWSPPHSAKVSQNDSAEPVAMTPASAGTGLATVRAWRMPSAVTAPMSQLLDALPAVTGDWGSGHILASAVYNVLFTDDGRVIAGAVDPSRLYVVASSTS